MCTIYVYLYYVCQTCMTAVDNVSLYVIESPIQWQIPCISALYQFLFRCCLNVPLFSLFPSPPHVHTFLSPYLVILVSDSLMGFVTILLLEHFQERGHFMLIIFVKIKNFFSKSLWSLYILELTEYLTMRITSCFVEEARVPVLV